MPSTSASSPAAATADRRGPGASSTLSRDLLCTMRRAAATAVEINARLGAHLGYSAERAARRAAARAASTPTTTRTPPSGARRSSPAASPTASASRRGYRAKDGSWRWLRTSSAFEPDEALVYARASRRHRARSGSRPNARTLLDRGRALARGDALTGLPNRRGARRASCRAMARARRAAQVRPLPGDLDIDHFKAYNDAQRPPRRRRGPARMRCRLGPPLSGEDTIAALRRRGVPRRPARLRTARARRQAETSWSDCARRRPRSDRSAGIAAAGDFADDTDELVDPLPTASTTGQGRGTGPARGRPLARSARPLQRHDGPRRPHRRFRSARRDREPDRRSRASTRSSTRCASAPSWSRRSPSTRRGWSGWRASWRPTWPGGSPPRSRRSTPRRWPGWCRWFRAPGSSRSPAARRSTSPRRWPAAPGAGGPARAAAQHGQHRRLRAGRGGGGRGGDAHHRRERPLVPRRRARRRRPALRPAGGRGRGAARGATGRCWRSTRRGRSCAPARCRARAVLAFGTERHGLSDELLERADARIAIPMRAGVSSLNLATSVAVTLFAMRLAKP